MEDVVKWLSGNPALSMSVFVVVSFVVTRLLDAGTFAKLPKWALPIVSTLVGCAGQVSVALVAGAPWKQAILLGIIAGLGGSGFYSVGGKLIPRMGAADR